MFRRLVDWVPKSLRRRILLALPAGLDQHLRARYYRQPLIRRAVIRWSQHRLRRRHEALLALPGVRVTAAGRRAWLSQEIERLSVEGARQHHLDLMTGLLDGMGVEYFVVNTGSHLRHCVAVAASHRQRMLTKIAEELGGHPVYVSIYSTDRSGARHVLAADLRVGQLPEVPFVRVGQVFASGCGRLVLGLAHGCDVEFWDEQADGTLLAPRANRVSRELRPEHRIAATTMVRQHVYRTVEPFTRPSVVDVEFPVDVVYTWVDGEDPTWRAKKEHHLRLAGLGPINDQAANSARFLSRDELKYSLRSLSLYADWVRTVYLVTDDQVPTWLDTSNPRLRLVSHRELFGDTGSLPTFNSHAIESRLHHIEGLSEHYLYLNDDVFFGRAVAPALFFHSNGLSKFFMSKAQLDLGAATPFEPPVMSAGKNNRQLIAEVSGLNVTQKLKHVPHSQQRSVLLEMEQRFPERFAQTAASRFRSHHDISIASALHHYFAYSIGRAVPGEIRYAYTDNSDPDTPKRLQKLMWHRDSDVLCLNDTDLTGVDADEQADLLRDFLENYFPVPSAFERSAAGQPPEAPFEVTPEATPEVTPDITPEIASDLQQSAR